ncbi:ADP-ribosylglycohydrolase [Desulfosarcina variabilis str. Montpellier]|uniref:ADP-ribosylglycohydrolase family protein n=1 Tax=Desulfosarcina variabilis TaxID=2300 RepID=UPI003AFAF95E
MENDLYKKILGCLSMVAIGDALGMPCHDMTIDEIRERFEGPVEAFHPPFADTRVHRGLCAGQITDDTILTLAVAEAYIENDGHITPSLIAAALLKAYNRAVHAGNQTMFGPSTRKAMENIADGKDPVKNCLRENHPMSGASNGGAMKIAPVGLAHPGNIDAAIQDAVDVCLPSHCTQTAIGSACAMAAGVAEALRSDADVFSVVRAALAGARKGEVVGMQKSRTVPLPCVADRIELAVSLALKAEDTAAANRFFANIIGTGLPAYESIPTAIGIFVAAGGDPRGCVIAGANVGYDTDTIASMAGALAGALNGFDRVPADLFQAIKKANDIELKKIASGLERIARRNLTGKGDTP